MSAGFDILFLENHACILKVEESKQMVTVDLNTFDVEIRELSTICVPIGAVRSEYDEKYLPLLMEERALDGYLARLPVQR
jgi:hypothetical protein